MQRMALRTFASSLAVAAAFAGLCGVGRGGPPAAAQEAASRQDNAGQADEAGKDRDSTLDRAGDIATQPARDIGITHKEIPQVLQDAVRQPYATPRRPSCQWLREEHARLDAALGPDFDRNAQNNENKAGQLAAAGGEMLVNSLIPFRGVVREVSGAAAADRRRLAAMNAGLARRGYIRGVAATRGCAIQVTQNE